MVLISMAVYSLLKFVTPSFGKSLLLLTVHAVEVIIKIHYPTHGKFLLLLLIFIMFEEDRAET